MLDLDKIYHIDNREGIESLEDSSVDLLLTDPPYGISRETNFNTLKNHSGTTYEFGEWDNNVNRTYWIKLIKSKLKKGANVVCFMGWEFITELCSEFRENDIIPKRLLLYLKTNPPPFNRDRMFVNAVETAIWAVNENSGWTFNRQNDKYETGLFYYPMQSKKWCSTSKPLGLIEELIQMLSNPGDLVVDIFSGGGTTALGARNLSRKFIVFEKDEETYLKSLERMENAE